MEQIQIKPRMHIFVCINDRSHIPENTTPSCSPRISEQDVKEIKHWLQAMGNTRDIFCTKCKCLGFCNTEGSVLCIYPEGKFIKGIQNKEDIKKIIMEEKKKQAF